MTLVSALILVTLWPAFGQATTGAIEELHAGARSFKAGQFEAAQQHFQKAGTLDPTYKYTQLLLARALHFQYRLGDQSATNIALARRAIAAYKNYLAIDPQNYIAFSSVASLYGSLGESELQRLWLLERARLESAPKDKRAECYIVLASMQWFCSFKLADKLTDSPKVTVAQQQGLPPKVDAESFVVARKCVLDGLELIEKAIALDPANDLAWFYKAHLLSEMAKVGEREGGTSSKARYDSLAAEAKDRSQELKMKRPGKTEIDQKKLLTGDEELDEVINQDFLLTYLAVPVPIQ